MFISFSEHIKRERESTDVVSRWLGGRRGYLGLLILHSLEVVEGYIDQVVAMDNGQVPLVFTFAFYIMSFQLVTNSLVLKTLQPMHIILMYKQPS